MLASKKRNKYLKARYTEYYDLESCFDELYLQSKQNKIFNNLIDIITSDKNIKLAYRNIKSNEGSKTAGVDKKTIDDFKKLDEQKFIKLIKKQFSQYKPNAVRKVEIPKPNGKMRPLGIPTIKDRIIQQCILQVLEPICEAKFYEYSYGFRPNRSAENAISRCQNLMQLSHMTYTIDVDIKGFFDNVNHNKLIKQLWALGIRDKKLLCIIKSMLKAPIQLIDKEIVYPTKGTPQGGILSPLLSNIVLNELDWWISSQWETMKTKYPYKCGINPNGSPARNSVYTALRNNSNLKEVYIVRYADDFKLFCNNYIVAKRLMIATKNWLKERLHLEISEEKSKIVNLKTNYSEYLGFKLRLRMSKNKFVVCSHVSDKAKHKIILSLTNKIKEMQRPKKARMINVHINRYNAMIIGIHNYYQIATYVSFDFGRIAYILNNKLLIRLGCKKTGILNDGYIKARYGKSKAIRYYCGLPIVPIKYVRHKNALGKKRSVNRYTKEGREEIHKSLSLNLDILFKLMKHPVTDKSIEYADNRISLYSAQNGKCAVSGITLEYDDIYCHHKIPLQMGGSDKYNNLIIVSYAIHILIHATQQETIELYKKLISLNDKQIEKLNKLRKLVNLDSI